MPNYRRAYVPGGTFFLTIVTYRRIPIFRDEENVSKLRQTLKHVKREQPFDIPAAVVLPDHVHFSWSLPPGNTDYSRRIGRMKVRFTHALRGPCAVPRDVGVSRRKHRESNVWQLRFWEHTIIDEENFEQHLHYIHYKPVKHGLVVCPRFWCASSFRRWVRSGLYPEDWGCCCDGRRSELPKMAQWDEMMGE